MRDILIREEQPVKIMYPKGTVPDCKGDLSGNIGRCYRDQVQKKIVNRYLFDYYTENMSKYRDELDIEYEEFRDNSSYKIVSIIVANWTNTFIRVEFSISINPYKSKSMKDFPLQFYGLFDRTTAEFKRFGFAHPTVIVNK